jgi:tripartite ATP-independent transporter DctM subunit
MTDPAPAPASAALPEAALAPPHARPLTVELVVIVLITLVMVALPVIDIVLRRVRGAALLGASVYVQHCTLWLGFLGALVATKTGEHLGLSTSNFFKEGRKKDAALVWGSMVAAATCVLLTYASWTVVQANRQGSLVLAGGVPEWWSEMIVPITLGLMALRFIWHARAGWLGRALSLGACVAVVLALHLGQDHASAFLWPLLIVILSAFLLGSPVFVAMAGVAMLLFWIDGTPISSVPAGVLQVVENPTLPAIPLLTAAGYVLASGGASARLVRAYKSLFGWLPGGMALMVISVCALFTTFTGGSGVTILALGGLVLPALTNDKYPEGFSRGLVTASGSLGLLFPPSLPVILYAAVAGVAPDKLFLGGLVPGVLLIVVVAAYAMRAGIKAKAPKQPFDFAEARRALWAAKWDIGLPVIVLLVFMSGLATVVEAAALGGAYALMVELVVYHDIHPFKQMPKVLAQSATLVGAVVILLAFAFGLYNYLIDAQIPDALVTWVQLHFHSPWSFLLALNGLLLVLGSVFEIYASIIVLAPLIAPLGAAFHIDPVHLGVVFLANLELGFLLPPMGINLFLSAARFKQPLPKLYREAFPFLIIMAVGVLIITYVPALTTGMAALLAHH